MSISICPVKQAGFSFDPAPVTHSSVGNFVARGQIRRSLTAPSRFKLRFTRQILYEMRTFRGFIASLYGTSNRFYINLCDPMAPDFTGMTQDEWQQFLGVSNVPAAGFPWSDGTFWSDGTGWGLPVMGAPTTIAPAAEGQNYIEVSNPAALPLGAYFQYLNHLYVVAEPGTKTKISPVLRHAMPTGTNVEMKDLKILMRLSSDGEGVLDQIDNKYTDIIVIAAEEAW